MSGEASQWCRHRTAFTDEHRLCGAGVDFQIFRPESSLAMMPCLGRSPEAIARCDRYEAPDADREAAMASMARTLAMFALVPGEGIGGTFACPACGTGIVRWGRAPSNGHTRGRCSTPGCGGWIE